jgi:hypothetical protein
MPELGRDAILEQSKENLIQIRGFIHNIAKELQGEDYWRFLIENLRIVKR